MQGEEATWSKHTLVAFEAAKAHDWKRCQELCAITAEQPPPVLMAVSRLNIQICQYHLGHTAPIAERALPLIPHLPLGAAIACLGLSLLAAHKSGRLLELKKVVLVLAEERHQALDLPTVPTFVLLHDSRGACVVAESSDGSLMAEVVATFLQSGMLDPEETVRLQSLAKRYRERAATMVASAFPRETPKSTRKAWWKIW